MHAVARLLHRALRQADHVEGGEAARDVGLHRHQIGVDAEHGPGGDSRKQGMKIARSEQSARTTER